MTVLTWSIFSPFLRVKPKDFILTVLIYLPDFLVFPCSVCYDPCFCVHAVRVIITQFIKLN